MNSRTETKALVAKASRFIESARALKEMGDLESAVSRLYYAMFFCAEALLLAKGLTFSRHGRVIAAFGEHFVKPGLLPQELHRWLRDAFDKRQLADYEALPVFDKTDVDDLLSHAEEFLKVTKEFLATSGGV